MQDSSTPSWWLRLEVLNVGRGPADRIEVVVDRWWERLSGREEWAVHTIDPFALGWSSRPPANPDDPTSYASEIALPSGGRAMLNVAVHDESGLRVLAHDPRYRGFSFHSEYGAEEQRVELLISGEGIRSFRKTVRFSFGEKNADSGFGLWELSHPPTVEAPAPARP